MSTSDVKSARGGASTVATSRRTGATTQNTTNRLNSMADNMNNFYGDLDEETTIRKQAEEQRVVRLERELGKIERVISTETKRRIEASKVLQTMFEEKLIAMQKEFREELHATYSSLQAQIDLLTVRVEKLEQTMIEERKNREAEIQKANKELLDKFSEHVKQFEVEKVSWPVAMCGHTGSADLCVAAALSGTRMPPQRAARRRRMPRVPGDAASARGCDTQARRRRGLPRAAEAHERANDARGRDRAGGEPGP